MSIDDNSNPRALRVPQEPPAPYSIQLDFRGRLTVTGPDRDDEIELCVTGDDDRFVWLSVDEVGQLVTALAPLVPPPTPPAGIALITAERLRQQSEEGWTPSHDDQHDDGSLRTAAICYALVCDPITAVRTSGPAWPWHAAWWKPSADPIRNLVKAGALIAAEIDRLQRLEPAAAPLVAPAGVHEPQKQERGQWGAVIAAERTDHDVE